MLLPRMLLLALLGVATSAYAAFPNEPPSPGFGGRAGDTNSLLTAFAFDQQSCAAHAPFFGYGTYNLNLTANSTKTSCPTISEDGTTYSTAKVGILSGGAGTAGTVSGADTALMTGAIGTEFAHVFDPSTPTLPPSPTFAFSMEMWLTPTTTSTTTTQYMVEIGTVEPTGGNTVGTDVELRLVYRSGSPNQLILDWAALGSTHGTSVASASVPTPGITFAPVSAFGSAAKVNSTLFLAVTLEATSIFTVRVTWYTGELGVNSSFNSTQYDVSPIPNYGIQLFGTEVLRLGCSNYQVAAIQGYPAIYRFFSMYSRALTPTEALNHFTSGLPNSNPVVRTNYVWSVLEDTLTSVNLFDPVSWADADGNIPTKFWIESLPTTGNLYLDGILINTTHIPVNSTNNLTYIQTIPNQFSTNLPTTSCPTAYATFSYTAEDMCSSTSDVSGSSACVSPVQGQVNLCVVQVNDPPLPSNLSVTLRYGEMTKFTINATDPDDTTFAMSSDPDHGLNTNGSPPSGGLFFSSTTGYHDNANVYFTTTTGQYGYLTFWNGTACQTAQVPAQTWVAQMNQTFSYCFVYNSNPPASTFNRTVIGTEIFPFTFRDSAQLESTTTGYLSITITNPLTTCEVPPTPTPPPTPPNSVDNALCHTRGTTTAVAVYLVGINSLGGPLEYRVTTLPTFGKLYYALDDAGNLGAQIQAGDVVPLNTTTLLSTSPQAFYVPNQYYFNEIKYTNPPSYGYINLANETLDPCPAQGLPPCPCASTTSACPDSFQFTAKVKGQNIESTPGTYLLNVDASLTAPLGIVAPSRVVIPTGKRFYFNDTYAISITDNDDDVYWMAVMLTTSRGLLTVTTGAGGFQGVNDPDFRLDACGDSLETPGCKTLKARSHPSKLNQFLKYLSVYSATAFSNSSDAQEQLLISVFKPYPDGVDPDNFNYLTPPDLTKSVVLAPGDLPSSPSDDNGLSIAIIAGGAAVGFIALICFINAVVWFITKTRKAAKLARRSIRNSTTRNSQRLSLKAQQQLAAQADEYALREAEQQQGRVGFFGWLLGYKSADPAMSPMDEEIGRSSAAVHRDSSGRAGKSGSGRELVVRAEEVGLEEEEDDSIFLWEKHIDRKTGDVYYFNPRTGQSQWEQPTVKPRKAGK